jgi:integrase/recombinase XerD
VVRLPAPRNLSGSRASSTPCVPPRPFTGCGHTQSLRVARAAGISHPISPHGLRRTFCTTGLVAGINIRDMQYAMRHADPRTTMRYDMAKANLDRHAAHAVAAYLAGMSSG